MKKEFRGFSKALTFLTIIPLKGKEEDVDTRDIHSSLPWFPLVGFLLGLVLLFLDWVLQGIIGPSVRPVLVLITWIILTGGLHLDGLGDTIDGLSIRGDKDKTLRAMRDDRFGAFATAAVVLVLLAKYGALQSAPGSSLVLAPVIGRWGMVLLARISNPADEEGAGRLFAGYREEREFIISTIAVLAAAILIGGFPALIAMGAVAVFGYGVYQYFSWKIGGVTGDVFGFTCEISESLMLIIVSAWN